MKLTIAIKSLLALLFQSVGLISARLRNGSNNICILMYHRVISFREIGDGLQAGMYIEPSTFEMHIEYLLEHFEVVSVYDLLDPLRNGTKNANHKTICAITFDDGWYDFFKYAFPILKTYNVPAAVFLPTDYIGTSSWFWTDRVAHLFIQRGQSDVPAKAHERSAHALVNKLEDLQGSVESRTEEAIAMLKACGSEQIEKVLLELSTRWAVETVPRGRAFLSWEEVREMQRSGLVFFGSHTAGHRILTSLTDEEIRSELIRSKDKLIAEHAVDPLFIPFCYPNGNYNDAIVRCVQETGYDLAVTTEKGWNHPGSDRFTLKRIAVHQDMTSNEAMLGCRIAGIL